MKGLFKRLSILAASLAMVFGVGLVNNEKNAKAASGDSFAFNSTAGTSTDGVWKWHTDKNGSSNAPAFNSKDSELRLYAASNYKTGGTNGCSLTIEVIDTEMYAIKSITYTASSATYTPSPIFYNSDTASGDAITTSSWNSTQLVYSPEVPQTAITLQNGHTNPSSTKQLRIKSVKVEYIKVSVEKEVDSIDVTLKTSSSVYVDNSLTEDDIEVYVLYADATGEVIKNGYTIDPELPYTFSSSDVGEKTFTVTYENVTASFTLTVKEKPTDAKLSIITITEGENVKKKYYVGDSVDTTGLTVTAGYESESDSKYTSFVDVTDKVTWTLDTTEINTEAHLIANYTEDGVIYTAYIIVAIQEPPTYIVDKIVANNLSLKTEKIEYGSFTDVILLSGTKYAGTAAYNQGEIQLNDSKKSGIVSTSHVQKILTKIEIQWGKVNSSGGKTIDIYGCNSAFTDASDLYSTSATQLGSLEYDKNQTILEIPAGEKYTYIGIRPKKGATYLASVSFTWDESKEANDFINKWNDMRSKGSNGICGYLEESEPEANKGLLDSLLEEYDALAEADKIIVSEAADGENNTIGNTIAYIIAYKAAHTGSNARMNNAYQTVTNNISFIIIISVIGLSSVLGYYFIQKRRLVK